MATQKQAPGADIWFVTDIDTAKMDELTFDPHVNLAYYKDSTREYVSISGIARISQDRARIRALYRPDWKAWFGDQGGERNGGPDDPRIALIEVEAQSATYLKTERSRPMVLLSVLKGMVTGQPPQVGTVAELDRAQLQQSTAHQSTTK
jgi:general stress protein 26